MPIVRVVIAYERDAVTILRSFNRYRIQIENIDIVDKIAMSDYNHNAIYGRDKRSPIMATKSNCTTSISFDNTTCSIYNVAAF